MKPIYQNLFYAQKAAQRRGSELMEYTNKLKGDLAAFRDSVSALSGTINHCGINWQDEQFSRLSGLIGSIAARSRSVMDAVSKSSAAINQFEKIERM